MITLNNLLSDKVTATEIYTVYECHCEGDIEKVVTDGLPELPAGTMIEKLNYFRQHHDNIRQFFLHEPRGGMAHCVNFIVPSDNPAAAYGFLIGESEEYPLMSGGNTISVATVLLKSGMIPATEPVTRFTLESPAGLIDIECDCQEGRIGRVKLINQPAFVHCLDRIIEVPDIGKISVDVAWGGMNYAITDARQFGFELIPSEGKQICDLGKVIKTAAHEQIAAQHPEIAETTPITQTMFTLPVKKSAEGLVSKNAVVVSPGRIDRCPCGTGTSARLAVMHVRGKIGVGENFVHHSIIDTTFHTGIISETKVGTFDAVIPAISGQSWIMGVGQWILEHDDPLPTGYTISDTWPT